MILNNPTIEMTVSSYNMLPARQRKTVDGQCYVLMGCGEWRRVVFVTRREQR